MEINGQLDARQLRDMKRELARRDLPPAQQRRFLWRVAKHGIVTAAKRNQRNQQAPDGRPWPPRKRGKQKTLRGLPKLLAVRYEQGRDAVVIYLRGRGGKKLSAGVLGQIHAEGATTTVQAASIKQRPQGDEKATRRQALQLRKLGYKRRKGNRWIAAPASWIVQNMRRAQAGLLIRELNGEEPKKSWRIEIPARVFLGVNDAELNRILARQLQAIDFGWQTKAQDIKGKAS